MQITMRSRTGLYEKRIVQTSSPFGFLTYDYKPNCFYWDIEVMMIKLLISLVPVMAPFNAASQAYGGSVIMLLAVGLYLCYRPHRNRFDVIANSASLVISAATLIIGLGKHCIAIPSIQQKHDKDVTNKATRPC